jgi:carbamoyltransferase
VLEENAGEYFHLTQSSPFMLLAPRVREEKKAVIPAVTHVDATARVQTVNRGLNPRFWALIRSATLPSSTNSGRLSLPSSA